MACMERGALQALIEARSTPEPNTGCWLWTGAVTIVPPGSSNLSYGIVYVGRKSIGSAHRVSFAAFRGIPGPLCVCHRCDQPTCVNPDHLFLGTQFDNVRDREAKGRGAKGERHARAKVTSEDVRTMRALKANGLTTRAIAARFGLHETTAGRLLNRRTWRAA